MWGHEHRDYKRIIHSREWHVLREAYITQHPMCEECLKRGIIDSVATEVHHRKPIGTGRSLSEKKKLAFDPDNLESLCHDCHVKIHQEMFRKADNRERTGRKDVLDFLKEDFDL